MDSIAAIHTAARQYCIERAFSWHQRYAELTARGGIRLSGADSKRGYTTEACNIFPRYQTLAAIQNEVERFLPADFSSLENARQLLEVAGETAQSNFTRFSDPTMRAAAEEERRSFALFIRAIDESRLLTQTDLPFCRVLGTAEHKQLHVSVIQRWGRWYGGCVDAKVISEPTTTLHIVAMEVPGSYEGIRAMLCERGIPRVLEIREYGDGFEIETQAADFTYNGAEGFWTSGDLDWLVYASHESSITFGSNWLVEGMKRLLPDFEKYIYKGWDLALYG